MSCDINIPLSGVKVAKENMKVVSQNISNANTEGYQRIELVQTAVFCENQLNGVDITGVSIATNNLLEKELLGSIAKREYCKVKAQYQTKIDTMLGDPIAQNDIGSKVSRCINALQELSTHPGRSSLQTAVIMESKQLIDEITSLSRQLNEMRYGIDVELHNTADSINSYLDNINSINRKLMSIPKSSMECAGLKATLTRNIRKIAEYFYVNCSYETNGAASLYSSTGITLLNNGIKYTALYDNSANLDSFIFDREIPPFLFTIIDETVGRDLQVNVVVVEGGNDGERALNVKEGVLSGMVDMRDVDIPRIINRLDAFTEALVSAINDGHNKGTGFPALSELRGTSYIQETSELGFKGYTLIALIDKEGAQVESSYPLKLEFDEIDVGQGRGNANLRAIEQEINYFFGDRMVKHNSVKVGDISDLKIVCNSRQLDNADGVNFDIELENFNGIGDVTVSVNNITLQDNLSQNYTVSYDPNKKYVIEQGGRHKFEAFSIGMPIDHISYPYTVILDVSSTDALGVVSNSSINYVIDDSSVADVINGMYGVRLDPKTADRDGVINLPEFFRSLLTASVVDEKGMEVEPSENSGGFLMLNASSEGYKIAIDQMNSSQDSYFEIGEKEYQPTELGFSSFFGLNDLFIYTDASIGRDSYKNKSYYVALRSDIEKDPSLFSCGKPTLVLQNNTANCRFNYKVELNRGDNSGILELINAYNSNINFRATDTIQKQYTTLLNYSNEMYTYSAIEINQAKQDADNSDYILTAFINMSNDITGVDINTEMAKLISLQEIFASSAYAMKTMREMFQIFAQSL